MFSNWSGAKEDYVTVLNKTEVTIDNMKPWRGSVTAVYKDEWWLGHIHCVL